MAPEPLGAAQVFASYRELLSELPRVFPPAAAARAAELARFEADDAAAAEAALDEDTAESHLSAAQMAVTPARVPLARHLIAPAEAAPAAPAAPEEGARKEEEEEEDGFDPDRWRRRQKKLAKAKRIAEANQRWGFAGGVTAVPDAAATGGDGEGGGVARAGGVGFAMPPQAEEHAHEKEPGPGPESVKQRAAGVGADTGAGRELPLAQRLKAGRAAGAAPAAGGAAEVAPPEERAPAESGASGGAPAGAPEGAGVGLGLTFSNPKGDAQGAAGPGLSVRRIKEGSAASRSDLQVPCPSPPRSAADISA